MTTKVTLNDGLFTDSTTNQTSYCSLLGFTATFTHTQPAPRAAHTPEPASVPVPGGAKADPATLDIFYCGHNSKLLVRIAPGVWAPMTYGNATRALAERCGISTMAPIAGMTSPASEYLTTIISNPERLVNGYGQYGGAEPGVWESNGMRYLVLQRTTGEAKPQPWNGSKPTDLPATAQLVAPAATLNQPQAAQPAVEPQPESSDPVLDSEPAVTTFKPRNTNPSDELKSGDMNIFRDITSFMESKGEFELALSDKEWKERVFNLDDTLTPRTVSYAISRLSKAFPALVSPLRQPKTGCRLWRIVLGNSARPADGPDTVQKIDSELRPNFGV